MSSILDQIRTDLESKLTDLVSLVEQQETLEFQIGTLKDQIKKLNTAYEALTGATQALLPRAEEEPRQPAPKASPVPVRQGVVCNSCDGEMHYQSRTLQSGRVVSLWVCGECSNERL